MRRYLSHPIHISWHISTACFGVVIGVALLLRLPPLLFGGAVWLLVGAGFLLMALVRRTRLLLAASLVAGVSIGIWRGAIERDALLDYVPYYGDTLQLSGVVNEDALIGRRGEQQLQLANVRIGSQTFHGRVWASVSSGASVKRGDTVFLQGSLDKGFGNTAASMHRAKLEYIKRPYPGDVARRVRDWFADGVRLGIPEPQASLGIGYLTGQRSTLPASLDEQLRIVGLTHAVVASGYNLTVLVGFARRVFARISRYLATLFAALMIGGFVLVTGFSPSMSRAGLVAGLSLAAWYWGRTIHPFVLLPFAACVTVIINPSYVWGDIGWYLSFTAFAGVVVMAPLMRRYFWGQEKKGGTFKQIVTDTAAAQLATMPIILCVFGQFSVYALPANVLVLPFVPLAMLLTFLSGVTNLVLPGLASVVSLPAELLLRYMTWIVERIAGLPGAQEQIVFTVPMLVFGYTFLIGLCVFWRRRTGYIFRE